MNALRGCLISIPLWILLVIAILNESIWGSIISGVLIVFFMAYGIYCQDKKDKLKEKLFKEGRDKYIMKVEKLCLYYRNELAIERSKLVTIDIYGNYNFQRWRKKGIDYFINRVMVQNTTPEEMSYLRECYVEIVRIVERVAHETENKMQATHMIRDDMDGLDYEALCKEVLISQGWKVSNTSQSGDQGVDLLATKKNISVAIQCKKYSGSVGNKAVQEVSAGVYHYHTDYGVVVSNANYTRAAQELAKTNRILLLHHEDLNRLDTFFQKIK